MREQQMAKRYLAELFGSIAIYTVLLVAAIHFGRPMAPGTLRLLVLLSPMIGFGLMIWVVARHFSRVDEYIRRLLLENTAIAAAITAAGTFTYGFVETAGYPRLSMFSVWMLMGSAWAATAVFRKLFDR